MSDAAAAPTAVRPIWSRPRGPGADRHHLVSQAVADPAAMTPHGSSPGRRVPGRSTAARAFAAALLCPEQGCGQCRECRTALGHHADVGSWPPRDCRSRSTRCVTSSSSRRCARASAVGASSSSGRRPAQAPTRGPGQHLLKALEARAAPSGALPRSRDVMITIAPARVRLRALPLRQGRRPARAA